MWGKVFATMHDMEGDKDRPAFQRTLTEFRITVLTTSDDVYRMVIQVETATLARNPELFGWTLDKMLATMTRELNAAGVEVQAL